MAGLLDIIGATAEEGFEGFRLGEGVKQEREKLRLEGEELRGEEAFREREIGIQERGVGVREADIKLQREKFQAEQESKKPIDFSQAVNQFPRSVRAELFSRAKATGKLDENNMIPADEAEEFREEVQDDTAFMIRMANTGIKDFSDDEEAALARKAEILRKRSISPKLGDNPAFVSADKELAPIQAEIDAARQGKDDYAGIKQHFEGVMEEERGEAGELTRLQETRSAGFDRDLSGVQDELSEAGTMEEKRELVLKLVDFYKGQRSEIIQQLRLSHPDVMNSLGFGTSRDTGVRTP